MPIPPREPIAWRDGLRYGCVFLSALPAANAMTARANPRQHAAAAARPAVVVALFVVVGVVAHAPSRIG